MKRVFTFGCSFTSFSWPTWADILVEDFKNRGLEGYNFGRCGAGNQFIFIKLIEANAKFKFNEDDLILICWSTMQREDRFVNNEWITPGLIYNQNIYTELFVNAWADPAFYVFRDSAIISATNLVLKQLRCKSYQFSMHKIKQLDSNNSNSTDKGTNAIIDFYGDDLHLDFVPMMEYLNLNDHSDKAAEKRLQTYYGDETEKDSRPEWHPTVSKHRKYLSDIILPTLNLELIDKTEDFIEKWDDKIKNYKGAINLSKTGWESHPRRDLINIEDIEKEII
jgi:hypothetical protein